MNDRNKLIKSGKGWRIGWNQAASQYLALLGTDEWAVELTAAEMQDFCRLFIQLNQTMADMENHLMEGERVSCEAETDLLWLEVEGYPQSYSLRLILCQGRCCEGNWQEDAVSELLKEVHLFNDFFLDKRLLN